MATLGVLTTSYPHERDPVAGFFVRGMARALAERGHHLEVLTPAAHAGPPLLDPGVEVRAVRYAPLALERTFYRAGVPDNVRSDVRSWPGLVTLPAMMLREARARARGWDAIISHWALPSALIAGRVRDGRPHLAVLHSADVHLIGRLPLAGRLAARVGASATELLFASRALREQLLALLPPVPRADLAGRCHASAMGIDPLPDLPTREDARRQLDVHGFTVLALGRLVPIKGLSHAIDAVNRIGATLLIAGDGPEREALARRAAALGARVRFLGVQIGDAKAAALRAADALVAPSLVLPSRRTEGTPTALLEAALAGLPIVASPTGGIAEVFEHDRSALLVAPAELDAALLRLRDEEGLAARLREAAREIARAYRWSELAPRVEALLLG